VAEQMALWGGSTPGQRGGPGRTPPDAARAFELVRECERVLPLVLTSPDIDAVQKEAVRRAAEKLYHTLKVALSLKPENSDV